jgi:excisionase family DNA binding protein
MSMTIYMPMQDVISLLDKEGLPADLVGSIKADRYGGDKRMPLYDLDNVRQVIKKNRPASVGGEFSFEKENSMIAINHELEPFERIALGIERLIEVLVPKVEAPSSPAVERLSPLAAAKQMRLNEQTVMKWCREGRLVASKLGGKWLIPQESVNAFIRKCEVIHGRRGGK